MVMTTYRPMPTGRTQRRWWATTGAEISGALLCVTIIPNLIWMAFNHSWTLPQPNLNASAGGLLAMLIGSWLARNLSKHPGLEVGTHVPLAQFAAFSTTGTIFLVTRVDYSLAILFGSFIVGTAWSLLIYAALMNRKPMRIAIVPFGDTHRLRAIPGVNWVSLVDPGSVAADVTAVAADLRSNLPDAWERQLTEYALAGVPVYHFKQLIESFSGQVEVDHLSENSLGSLVPPTIFLRMKGLVDRVTAALLLIVLLPILVIVGIIIRLESPGPAIFRQKRMGYRGEVFTVFKFRTMRPAEPGQEEARENAMTLDKDPRITRLGAFLRQTRIDELPQALNVLRGEMSWIGPRPEVVVLSQWYAEQIPFYRYRHIVRPGITGWAQVNQGHVTSVEAVREKLNYDFYYVQNLSLWLDFLIVAKTIKTMLTKFGAK